MARSVGGGGEGEDHTQATGNPHLAKDMAMIESIQHCGACFVVGTTNRQVASQKCWISLGGPLSLFREYCTVY